MIFQSPDLVVGSQLDAGERLLWCGQPRGGIRLRGQDALLIPFSLMWGGFACFWEFMALSVVAKAPGPVGIIFPLFGLPFVIIGLYMIFGRFIADARGRARTFYGVTNERVIIISGIFSRNTKSLQLRTLTDVSLTQRSDGSGSITFGPAHFTNFLTVAPYGSWPGRTAPPCFEMVERAKDVFDIIRNAQKAASGQTS
jgi:hypothetical protein